MVQVRAILTMADQ